MTYVSRNRRYARAAKALAEAVAEFQAQSRSSSLSRSYVRASALLDKATIAALEALSTTGRVPEEGVEAPAKARLRES